MVFGKKAANKFSEICRVVVVVVRDTVSVWGQTFQEYYSKALDPKHRQIPKNWIVTGILHRWTMNHRGSRNASKVEKVANHKANKVDHRMC